MSPWTTIVCVVVQTTFNIEKVVNLMMDDIRKWGLGSTIVMS